MRTMMVKTMVPSHNPFYDHDYEYDLGHDYGNSFNLDHLQDVGFSKREDWNDGQDNDKENDDDNGDACIDLDWNFVIYHIYYFPYCHNYDKGPGHSLLFDPYINPG